MRWNLKEVGAIRMKNATVTWPENAAPIISGRDNIVFRGFEGAEWGKPAHDIGILIFFIAAERIKVVVNALSFKEDRVFRI